MTRFPIIVGPTAGGKSALAFAIAREVPAEIISADAFQVYKGMDIGTAKPTPEEQRAVRHHLIDIREPGAPGERFTASDWLRECESAIHDIHARGKVPIVVGGTHLYVKSLLDGMFDGPGQDAALRESLRARGLASLREELERVDPQAAGRIHFNDERRTIRALEVFRLTGTPISAHQSQWDRSTRTDCVLVGLDWPSELINPRINARVKQMIERGLIEEVRALWKAGKLHARASPALPPALPPAPSLGEGELNQAGEALGYKQLVAHFEGRCTLEDAVEAIKIETRRFAKNQRTWLKRLRLTPGSVWINAAETPPERWPSLVLDATHGAEGTSA